ncbi:Uncharacterized protein Adt_03840 [Abeliophyllum distichum]|uniref:Transmembrane protein n=1 Tax=Abeliophyllum distichum TaxID=126358 RepID=A0ABD1VZM3_9LAMI
MESMINYVQEMLKKNGAESMIDNIQMQVKLKGIEAVSAMKNFHEKLDKTGNTYKVVNYLLQIYVQRKLKMENMLMQVISKGSEAVSAMKNFKEKLDKTGNTYRDRVMVYLQQKLAHSQFIVIIIVVVVLFVFVSHFGCKICRGKAGSKTMKAPGRKTGERILRNKFENNPRSYFQNLRVHFERYPSVYDQRVM